MRSKIASRSCLPLLLFLLVWTAALNPGQSAWAEETASSESLTTSSGNVSGSPQVPYCVSDTAGTVTQEEWVRLESTAEELTGQYDCGVYIITLGDYRDYESAARSFRDFSQEFYTRYELGVGEEKTGILLLMSMENRDYSLLAHGQFAHEAFTDYGKTVLEDRFLPDFRRNDWYGGFMDYLSGCGELLAAASRGEPVDVPASQSGAYGSTGSSGTPVFTALVCGGIPSLVAFAVCQGMRRKMKPVHESLSAEDYIVPGSVRLRIQKDVFVNRSVTRTVIKTEDRSHHSGGGTTVNSHGFSGHSGKF